MKRKIHCFDFDGTLTTCDTLLAFIRFARGMAMFVLGFALHLPILLLMKLKLYPNYKAKQRIFSFFFKEMPIKTFEDICQDFARHHQNILRPQGMEKLHEAVEANDEVLIVSASIDQWVAPFFQDMPRVKVLGTQIEVREGKVTGRFLTPNCYGTEKVRRIEEVLPAREDCYIIAYGDSRGDKEILEYADEGYYKPFRR